MTVYIIVKYLLQDNLKPNIILQKVNINYTNRFLFSINHNYSKFSHKQTIPVHLQEIYLKN